MTRELLKSAMAPAVQPTRSVVVAATPCHITRAITAALKNKGETAEIYLEPAAADVDAEGNPIDPAPPADESAAVESQQLDHAENEAISAQLQARLDELMDNGVYTGGRHVYVLTDGMYTGDDPTQHAMLKSIVEKSVSNAVEVEAVILDEDQEENLLKEASNAALESFLGSVGVKVTRASQMWQRDGV